MKFIKISLLSLLLLFLGLFGIAFGTLVNNSSNNSSNVNLLKSERAYAAPIEDDFSLEFDENYLEDDGEGNRIYITADWHSPTEYYPGTTSALIRLRDTSPGGTTTQGEKVFASTPDKDKNENNFLTETIDEDGIYYWHYEAMIENNTFDGVRFYLEDNHEYIISVELNQSSVSQDRRFTTPSKSVINLTETTGKVLNVTDKTVVLDTSWLQDPNQVDDNVFSIEENLELTLKTGTSSSDYDETSGDIDISGGGTTTVTGLDTNKEYTWYIEGTYFNGYDNSTIGPFYLPSFTTNKGVNYKYDSVKLSSTDNSITVELEITNEDKKSVDVKFYYDGSSKSGELIELTEVTMIDSQYADEVNPDIVWGWVTYEITGIDYSETYDLYIQINDNRVELLGPITTLDAYPWTYTIEYYFISNNSNWSYSFSVIIWLTIHAH